MSIYDKYKHVFSNFSALVDNGLHMWQPKWNAWYFLVYSSKKNGTHVVCTIPTYNVPPPIQTHKWTQKLRSRSTHSAFHNFLDDNNFALSPGKYAEPLPVYTTSLPIITCNFKNHQAPHKFCWMWLWYKSKLSIVHILGYNFLIYGLHV